MKPMVGQVQKSMFTPPSKETPEQREERRAREVAVTAPDQEENTMREVVRCAVMGRGLYHWCKENKIGYYAMQKWINSSPDRRAKLDAARREGAHVLVERSMRYLEERAPKLKNGGIDPAWVNLQKERAASQRWLAARLLPKDYGEKQTVEHTGTIDMRQVLAEREAKLKTTYTIIAEKDKDNG